MIYDISMSIFHEMPVYKNKADKRPVVKAVRNFAPDTVYESRIDMDLHTGTHVDAPLHILKDGGRIEDIPLDRFVGKCCVLDMTEVCEKITESDLMDKTVKSGDFVLLKTKNSFGKELCGDFVYLEESGAAYLASAGVTGVGIDALGIERSQPGHPTHNILLGSDIVILEGLQLSAIEEGDYVLFAVPLNIKGAEASPVRAFLMDKDAIKQLVL